MVDATTEANPETTTTSEPTEQTQEVQETKDPVFSQADLDKAVSKALNTREKALKEESETRTLKEKEDFAALSERQETQIKTLKEDAARSAYIAEHGLGDFSSVMSHVPVENMDTVRDAITNTVNAAVLKQVSKQLETPTPVAGEPTAPKAIKDMSIEEYKAHKLSTGATY